MKEKMQNEPHREIGMKNQTEKKFAKTQK